MPVPERYTGAAATEVGPDVTDFERLAVPPGTAVAHGDDRRARPGAARRRMPALLALAMTSAVLFGGCADDSILGRYVTVLNQTSQELHFIRGSDGEAIFLDLPGFTLPAGKQATISVPEGTNPLFNGRCTFVDIVALNAQDQEVGRLKPPLCIHEDWIVGAPAPSAP
jgi:hypothetical protein